MSEYFLNFSFQKVQNWEKSKFRVSKNGRFCTFWRLIFRKSTKSRDPRMAKTAFLELLESPKLVSRKIWVTKKILKFPHTVLGTHSVLITRIYSQFILISYSTYIGNKCLRLQHWSKPNIGDIVSTKDSKNLKKLPHAFKTTIELTKNIRDRVDPDLENQLHRLESSECTPFLNERTRNSWHLLFFPIF